MQRSKFYRALLNRGVNLHELPFRIWRKLEGLVDGPHQ